MTPLGRAMLGLALLLAGPASVDAGSFQVTPVNAILSDAHAVEAFTVRNTGAEATIVQVELVRWSQDHGKDVLEPAGELLATPPLFRIGGGEAQVVRVGLRHAAAGSTELAYRVILSEVPPPPPPGFRGLAVALRLSVPLFIQPPTDMMAPALDWGVTVDAGGGVSVTAANRGNAHAKVIGLALRGHDGAAPLAEDKSLHYVLAGQAATWAMAASQAVHAGDALVLDVRTEMGEKHIELAARGDR